MAVATYNVFSPHRDFCMKNILNACIEKKWSIAENLAEDYADYCKSYWEEYSSRLNFEFHKCGSCFGKKQSLVKLDWSESEKYPYSGQLVCMDYTCKFYLIINIDQHNFLAVDYKNGEN